MAPVNRAQARSAAPSRRAATPPAQSRRTAAAAPTRKAAADEADEPTGTAFDADAQDGEEPEYDEDNLPETIDLASVEASSYEVVPKGWYPGYIEGVEYGLSQSKSLPMLTWTLKYEFEDKERTIRHYTTLTGDGAGRTKAFLARLDPELDLETLKPAELDEWFSEMEVNIRIVIRPDREDRKIKRNNVADVVPLEDAEAE